MDGVKLIVGDKCIGMLEAVGEVFPDTKYQRCTVHFYRNVFSVVPKSKVKIVAKMLKAIHAQESKKAAREKARAVVEELCSMKLKEAVKSLTDGQVAPEVIEGEDAYYVARMDSVFDEDATKSKKESIVSERKQEAYNNLLEEWGKDTKIEVDKKVWKKVTLTDSDAYTFKQPETQGTDNGSSDTGAADTGETGDADNGNSGEANAE